MPSATHGTKNIIANRRMAVFVDGKKVATLRGPAIAEDFQKMVADYIENRYGLGAKKPEAAE